MQTVNIDGTTYTIKFDRDPIALAKLARKPYKLARFKDLRKFPKRADLSTADYIREFDKLNCLVSIQYIGANETGTPYYDSTIPLLQEMHDEN